MEELYSNSLFAVQRLVQKHTGIQTGKKSPGETGRQGSATLLGPRNSWEVAGFCYVNTLSISLENKSCY